jgi:hypothetical protein
MGVGCFGLPIDAGIVRTTWSSMLTVNVCASMSATPTTAAAVPKVVLKPSAVTEIVECAGQNPVGVHCTASLESQVNVPAGVFGEEKAMARSAAARSATDLVNLTVTGIPTPTTSPGAGATLATVAAVGAAAPLVAATPGNSAVDTPTITASTYRSALLKISPFDSRPCLHARSLDAGYALADGLRAKANSRYPSPRKPSARMLVLTTTAPIPTL